MAFASDFGLGTLISNMSEVYGSGQRRHKEDIRRRNEQADFDRSRMAPDMMARVEAAKSAGLHPLVAMGSSVASGSPMLSATPPAPQVQFSSRTREDPNVARYNAARADLAELDVVAARNRLASQPGNSGGAILDESSDMSSQSGRYQLKPSEVATAALRFPNFTAGPSAPGMSRFTVLDVGGEPVVIQLPSKDSSEPLEGMGELWKAILGVPMGLRAARDVFIPKKFRDRVDSEYRAPWARPGDLPDDLLERIRAWAAPDSRRRAQGRMFPR